MKVLASILLSILLSSCEDIRFAIDQKLVLDKIPKTSNVLGEPQAEDLAFLVELPYKGNSKNIRDCNIVATIGVVEQESCECNEGVCRASFISEPDFNGAAKFSYSISTQYGSSNTSEVDFIVLNVDDAPTTTGFIAANGNEDVPMVVILPYNDIDGDLAHSCQVSGLTNLSITTPCSCDLTGVCTVGVQGSLDYSGNVGFTYSVTTKTENSNTSSVSFQLSPVNDAPNLSLVCSGLAGYNKQYSCSPSYTDDSSHNGTGYSFSSNTCSFLSIHASSGVIQGIPSEADAGNCEYSVVYNDGNLDSNIVTKNLTVAPPYHLRTDQEWIRIPANFSGYGLAEFYVMKYEAKAWRDTTADFQINFGDSTTAYASPGTTYLPASTHDYRPWAISASNASIACSGLGTGYDLLSNREWMAIARDIEQQTINWTTGTVGSGCVIRSNSNDTTCGYNGADPEFGTGRNIRAKHSLSTGDDIFDIAGNMFEWVDWDHLTPGLQASPTTCSGVTTQVPSASCAALAYDDYQSISGTLTNTQGIGVFKGGAGGTALRGGAYNWGAGIYSIRMDQSQMARYSNTGFRCVYRP